MGSFKSIFWILILSVSACGKLAQKNLLNSEGQVTLSVPFFISSLSPNGAKAGEALTAKGFGFASDLTVSAGDDPVTYRLTSSSEITLTMPDGPPGLITLSFQKGEAQMTLSLLRLPAEDNAVMAMQPDASQICEGDKVYSLSGEEVVGLKKCGVDPCNQDGEVGCMATEQFRVADVTRFSSADVRTGVTIAGISGVITNAPGGCSADGATGCLANNLFPAIDNAKLVAGNIKKDVTIGGVTGSVMEEEHSDCSSDSQTGCVVKGPSYAAALLGNIATNDLRQGRTIAGIQGSLDLSNIQTGNIKKDVTIDGVTGSLIVEEHSDCNSDGQTGCVVKGPSYAAALLGNIAPSDLRLNKTIAGIPGSLDLTNLNAANIKNNVTIAGIVGTYPSAANPLPGAGVMADLPHLPGASTAAGSYEFWDSTGTQRGVNLLDVSGNATITPSVSSQTFNSGLYLPFTVAGDADLAPANIKNGVQIFGHIGTVVPSPAACGPGGTNCVANAPLKAVDPASINPWDIRKNTLIAGVAGELRHCKNAVSLAHFDNATGPAVGGMDIWDTVGDSLPGGNFPSQNPFASMLGATCNYNNWADLRAPGGCSDSALPCRFKDLNTNLVWSQVASDPFDWHTAIIYCETLDIFGVNNWRLPTQKELLNAYIDGIRHIESPYFGDLDNFFWSSTTNAQDVTTGFKVNLGSGEAHPVDKTFGGNVMCVTP